MLEVCQSGLEDETCPSLGPCMANTKRADVSTGTLGKANVAFRRGSMAPWRLALVAKALLVAVGLHALLTLVFVDLRLTTLLERAHVCLLLGLVLEGERNDINERLCSRDIQ